MKTFKCFLKESKENLMLRTDGHYEVHGISPEHLDWLGTHSDVLAAKGPVTITIPDHLPPVPNSLVGPSMGDNAVSEDEVIYLNRGGGRPYNSRMVKGPHKPTRMLTVISRPHKDTGKPFLITAFGGPLAPKEIEDPTHTPESKEESKKFWSQHALLTGNEL